VNFNISQHPKSRTYEREREREREMRAMSDYDPDIAMQIFTITIKNRFVKMNPFVFIIHR
jgi:hypothetical protein